MKKIQDQESKHENIEKNKNVNCEIKQNTVKLNDNNVKIEKNKIKNCETKQNNDNKNISSEKIKQSLKNDEKNVISSNNIKDQENVDSINECKNIEKNITSEIDIKYESSKKTKNESKVDNTSTVVSSISDKQNMHDMACSPMKFEESVHSEAPNKILPPLKSLKKLEPIINRSNYAENDKNDHLYNKAQELISINNDYEKQNKTSNNQDEEQ